ITINLSDVNEFPVSLPTDVDGASNSVVENAVVNTPVAITAQAVDQDGTNNVVSYSLLTDAGGLFKIDSVTGVVTVAAAGIDYETATSHEIIVRATSSDLSFNDESFTIAV